MVGVTATEEPQLHPAIAEVEIGGLGERAIGRIDDHLGEVGRELRHLRRDPRLARLAGPLHERTAADVTPDRGGPEDVVAEGVVEVAVRVDDDRDRRRRQLAKVVEDLATLDVARSRVDDHALVAAQHDPDVLVEERVATHEHPVADLGPARHAGHGSRGRWAGSPLGLDK